MLIKDIMVKEVICVNSDTPISEVTSLLSENRIHGVPVIDKDRKVLGIITETDFFTKDASNMHLPSFIDFIRSEAKEAEIRENPDMKPLLDATAKDIMSSPCETMSANQSVEELITYFKNNSYTTMPVIDEKGILCGIVTVADIIRLL